MRLLPLIVLAGCSPLTPPTTKVPTNVTCDRSFVVSKDVAATLALAKAPGDCVLLPSGTFTGNFVVPANVSLLAGEGETVTLKGADMAKPVLTITGGRRTTLKGFRIDLAGGPGLVIEPGPVNLVGISVTGATQALSITCAEADCGMRETTVEDCDLDHNGLGLVARGATVKVMRSRVAFSGGPRLTDGVGIVALGGAVLQLDGTMVESNDVAGVVLDGAATRGVLTGVTVRDNLGRGVWAQGLVGTDTLAATNLTVARNRLAGVGATNSQGLTVRDSTISETAAVMVPVDLTHNEAVGDGLALFGGVSGATLERVTVQNNARAQLLIDTAGAGISATALTASGGRFRAVVQRSTATVQVEAAVVDMPPAPLLVVDAPLTVP